jgi:hypothetical protein
MSISVMRPPLIEKPTTANGQHCPRHRFRAIDRHPVAGPDVHAEDRFRVEYGDEPVEVAGSGGGEKGVHHPALLG